MKILHVVSYFPPDRIGGIGEVVNHLHAGLLHDGHKSEVLTAGLKHDNPLVTRIASSPLKFVTGLTMYAKKTRDFDLVHCHQGETISLPLMMKIRRISTPVLVTFHVGHRGMAQSYHSYRLNGRIFKTGWKGIKYRTLTSRFHQFSNWLALKLADSISFISYSSAVDILGSEGAGKANIVYNGIPIEEIMTRESLPKPADLLYVGNGSHRKRVFALPFLLMYIRQSLPEVKLRIVGLDFKRQRDLKKLFEEFGLLDAVICEGELPSSLNIRSFYMASKVLVIPSIYEGLPMVILEAMQNGLPCVATRVSGHPEVIKNGQNGFLVEKDNPRQMADCCIKILSDPMLQQKLGRTGRKIVSNMFNLNKMISEYLNLYKRICKK